MSPAGSYWYSVAVLTVLAFIADTAMGMGPYLPCLVLLTGMLGWEPHVLGVDTPAVAC